MKFRNRTIPLLATLAVATLGLSACGAAPDAPGAGGTAGAATDAAPSSDFLACMVSDSGGFDDHSFNELGLKGLEETAKELGIQDKAVESATEDDYASNIEGLLGEGCNLIVTVGYLLSAATISAANANPDVDFAIVDDTLDPDGDGTNNTQNGKPLLFNTAEAAFLAGYAAAATTKSGIVGTYGGMQINPVTIFMDGFVDGVAYFNKVNGTSVKALGWDKEKQTGSIIGTFAPGVESKTAAQNLIDQGADVLLPAGGPIYQSAGEAIKEHGGNIAMIGVDADVYNTDKNVAPYLLTSIMKSVDAAVHDTIVSAESGDFDTTPYVGTIENGGVGIAPFHDWADKVPADLDKTLEELRAKIIAGDVTVTSPSTPK